MILLPRETFYIFYWQKYCTFLYSFKRLEQPTLVVGFVFFFLIGNLALILFKHLNENVAANTASSSASPFLVIALQSYFLKLWKDSQVCVDIQLCYFLKQLVPTCQRKSSSLQKRTSPVWADTVWAGSPPLLILRIDSRAV